MLSKATVKWLWQDPPYRPQPERRNVTLSVNGNDISKFHLEIIHSSSTKTSKLLLTICQGSVKTPLPSHITSMLIPREEQVQVPQRLNTPPPALLRRLLGLVCHSYLRIETWIELSKSARHLSRSSAPRAARIFTPRRHAPRPQESRQYNSSLYQQPSLILVINV